MPKMLFDCTKYKGKISYFWAFKIEEKICYFQAFEKQGKNMRIQNTRKGMHFLNVQNTKEKYAFLWCSKSREVQHILQCIWTLKKNIFSSPYFEHSKEPSFSVYFFEAKKAFFLLKNIWNFEFWVVKNSNKSLYK